MERNKPIYKIDMQSLTGMMITLIAPTTVLFVTITTVKAAQHDGWLSEFLTTLYGAYIIYIIYRLAILFPNKTLMEYIPLILGKVAGKTLGILYIIFFYYLASSVLREAIALFYGTGTYNLTPPIVLALLLIIASTYAVFAGFEVISRLISIYWIIISIFFVLTICAAIPYMQFNALLPLGEAGLLNIFKGSIVSFVYRGELVVLAMFIIYLKSPRDGLVATNIANILLTFFLAGMIAAMITALGTERAGRAIYAIFSLGDNIPPIGIKAFLTSLWVIALWGKITLLQFAICSGISQLFNLKSHHYVALPVAALLVTLSFSFYRNIPEMLISIPATFPGVALFFEYLIPTLLLVIALIKSKISSPTNTAGL